MCSGEINVRNTVTIIYETSRITRSCSEDANFLPETSAREVGEVDSEPQAEHINILIRVCVDVDGKLRRWDLLRKFDGLDDGVVTRLDRALDLQICVFTTYSISAFEAFDKTRGTFDETGETIRMVKGRLP